MNGVSILICCYNSSLRIQETLKHIFALRVPDNFLGEVILVNNNSSDNTKVVVLQTFEKHSDIGLTFKVIDEEKPGLSFARARGIQESRFDLIIFCDDDNHLDSNYLLVAKKLFETDLAIAVAGGWVKPKLDFYPGKWIEANYAALAVEAVSKEAGYVDWVFGAGMVVRKCIFDELKERGIQLHLTGRMGSKQTSGDDAELCQLARFIGYEVYYLPDLILDHQISRHRLTKLNFIKVNFMNVFMVVYFYILDQLIRHSEITFSSVRLSFLKARLYYLLYFFPRIFLGKNSFYSFMMFYQNFQLVFWIFLRKKRFFETFNAVKSNLYHDGGT